MNEQRYVVTIRYQWKDSDQVHRTTLWDVDSEIWLKENADQCSMIELSYPEWENIMDFRTGMAISLIRKTKDE